MTMVLIPLLGNDVAPRFDLAAEVLIATVGGDGALGDRRTMVLPQPSAENLCHLVVTEEIEVVVCGGIEEEYHQYLTWKRVRVFDSVMGPFARVLERFAEGTLRSGDILFDRHLESAWDGES